MLIGKVSVKSRVPEFLDRGHKYEVHDFVFAADDQKPVIPRLDGAAWMCNECDTLVLVGGW